MSGCKRGMAVSLHKSVSPLMNLCGVFPRPRPTVLSVTMALHQPWSLVFDNSHIHEGDVILIVPVCILFKVIDSDLFPSIYWTCVYWLESLSILRLSFISFLTISHLYTMCLDHIHSATHFPSPSWCCLLECSLILLAWSCTGNSGYCEFMSTVATS